MRPKKYSYTPADDSATGFASNQTGATCTLAATSAADGLAHLVIITNDSAVDHSDNGETFVLTGTDADGFEQTETVAGPGVSTTVTSTKYFKTLTSVVPSITWVTDTYDVGWTDDIVSPTIPLNYRQQGGFQVACGVDISGTIDYTVQFCVEELRPQQPSTAATAPSTLKWWNHEALTALTADAFSNFTVPVTACRLLINSLTTGATIALQLNQGN